MKKFLSISFSFLILLSVMHFTISTHYCGGEIAGSKVSVLGELASCGMEGSDDSIPLPGKHFKIHCCNDEVSVLEVDNNYAPSSFEFKAFSQPVLPLFYFPASVQINSFSALNLICTNVSPPGIFMVSDVSLPKICVFRI